MNVLQLIANDSFITTNKALIRQFGLIEANIVGLFASIHNYNESICQAKGLIFDGWFYATYEKLNEELGLSQYVASKPIEKLIEAGILLDKKQGVPCRRFFKFHQENLLNSLLSRNFITGNKETQLLESEKLDSKTSNNSTASNEEAPQQGDEKLGRNKNKENNTNKNLSLPVVQSTIEQILKERDATQERDFEVDVNKIWSYVKDENKLKASLKNVLKSLIEKPINQIKKQKAAASSITDYQQVKGAELTKKRYEIAKVLLVDADKFREKVGKLDLTQSGFELFPVEEFDVERWKEVLEKIGVKIKMEGR